jgi:hypothetical protein
VVPRYRKTTWSLVTLSKRPLHHPFAKMHSQPYNHALSRFSILGVASRAGVANDGSQRVCLTWRRAETTFTVTESYSTQVARMRVPDAH